MSENWPNKDLNTYDTRDDDSGMLSSSQIAYYQNKYLIIDGYKESCLGPATYHMRIGGEVLTWDKDERIEFLLGEEEDKNRNIRRSVELKPNSLTFVTTIEKFNLTKDIIGRFNLKSKWVHQGLLLGTGPIVDPQLNARLLIPIHNFSSRSVRMDYGDKIISVEFTKTLNPDDSRVLSDGEKTKFIENDNWEFEPKKYRKRIGDKTVESSVLSQLHIFDKSFKEYQQKMKIFTRFNIIGFIGVFVGIAALTFTTWNLIQVSHKRINDATNLIKSYDENSIDFRSFVSKSNFDELEKGLNELKKNTYRLNAESQLKSDKSAVELEDIRDSFDEEVASIKAQIEKLEKKLGK